MSTPPRDTRLAVPSTSAFLFQPPSIRHFVVRDCPAIELLDAVVGEMVARRTPCRALALVGPIGAGKRALARAIANEFGTPFMELEPHSPELSGTPEDLADLLASLGERPIVANNFDEFPQRARAALLRAIRDASLQDTHCASAEGLHRKGAHTRSTWQCPLIGTTNLPSDLGTGLLRDFMCFSVARCVEGSSAAITRTLRMHRIDCTPEAAHLLGTFVVHATGDLFADVAALSMAHVRHQGLAVLDGAAATHIVRCLWRFMSPGALLGSIKAAAQRDRCDIGEAAGNLHVPADLLANALTALPMAAALPSLSQQRQPDGDDSDDSDSDSE